MNRSVWLVFSLTILLSLSHAGTTLSWNDALTHKDISRYASEISTLGVNGTNYLKNAGFASGFEEFLVWGINRKQIKEWLATGGELEDDRGLSIARSKNHFHDPLKPWPDAGLSDLLISGKSALLWAQDGSSQISKPEGDWSWQRVRNLYYSALISPTLVDRDAYFAQTFKGLGHQMHLLQDMAVPYHVRNDGHPLDAILGKNSRDSYFETWTKNSIKKLADLQAFAPNPIRPILMFRTPTDNGSSYSALAPITQLFDANQYDGTNPSTSNDRGLSEYTNANYFSDDTINMPNVWVSDGHSFPHPNAGSTNLQAYISNSALPSTIIAEDGVADVGFWIKKIGDEPIEHFVKPGYTTNHTYNILGGGYIYYTTFVLDDKCHQDYAEKLLPRAVGYSAALLDYFFRGELTISFPDHCVYGLIDGAKEQTFKTLRAKVRNTTPNEELGLGTLVAVARYKKRTDYQPNLSADPPTKDSREPDFSYSVSEPITLTQEDIDGLNSKGDAPWYEFTFDFSNGASGPPIPAGITDLYLHVIFKGTLGNEVDNAVAAGMKDLGEPLHNVYMNSTDQFYYSGSFTTADQLKINNPTLYSQIKASGIPVDPYSVQVSIVFCPMSSEVDAFYDTMAPGAYGRIITIMEANVNRYPLAVYWDSEVRGLESPNITNQDVNDEFHPAEIFRVRNVSSHAGDTLIHSYPNSVGFSPLQIPVGGVNTSPIEASGIRLQ